MSINQLVIDTLAPLNKPVELHLYTGKATTYITFFEYNQREETSADDEEVETRYSIQVDVMSKGNLDNLVNQVKSLMRSKGFVRKSEMSLYNRETKTYRKSISFQIVL